MTQSPTHVLVVGGGITGLAAAYRLSQRDDHPTVTLVESADRLGGKLRTDVIDGFVVDSGPEALAPGKPHAAKLAHELGINLAQASPGAAGAVLVKGRLRTMPEGIGGFIPRQVTPLATTRLFSPSGKMRMALESVVPRRRDGADESLESFAARRLGRQAYRRLIEPVATGIFCGDPARLSLLATMPHLRAAEQRHGSLARAVLAERKAASGKRSAPRPGLSSPEAGMGAIADALIDRLSATPSVQIRLSTHLTSVTRVDDGYRATLARDAESAETVVADAIVLAVPTAAAADLLQLLGAQVPAATLRAMPCDSVATVSLGYRAAELPDLDRLLPAHGYLLAEPGRGPVRAVTRSSAKYPGRAPAGHELFRISIRPEADATDATLVSLARAELSRTLGIDAVPVLDHVQRWTGVMPQYEVGHLDRVADVERQLADYPGVVLAGSGTHGLGIADCVASAERAVAAIGA
jgi:oxygen-dependent protoporphyrinogen oxidase